jgi:hypothetical protein
MFVNQMLVALFAPGLFAVPRIQDSRPGPMALVNIKKAINTLLQGLPPTSSRIQLAEMHRFKTQYFLERWHPLGKKKETTCFTRGMVYDKRIVYLYNDSERDSLICYFLANHGVFEDYSL